MALESTMPINKSFTKQQQQVIKLVIVQINYRQQFKWGSMTEFVFDIVENIVVEKEEKKNRETAFTPFPTLFPKAFFVRFIKSRDRGGKQFTHYQTTNFRLFQTERLCRRQFQI